MFKKAVFAVAVVACLVWLGCSDSDSAPPPRSGSGGGPSASRGGSGGGGGGGATASRGGPAPARPTGGAAGAGLFRLPMVDGQAVTVRTPAVLYFFTTWCGYCQQALPQIKSAAERMRSRGFRVYGIDVNEDAAQVSAYVQRNQINFPVLLDQSGAVARQYGVPGYPTFVVVDQNGNIVYQAHEIPRNF